MATAAALVVGVAPAGRDRAVEDPVAGDGPAGQRAEAELLAPAGRAHVDERAPERRRVREQGAALAAHHAALVGEQREGLDPAARARGDVEQQFVAGEYGAAELSGYRLRGDHARRIGGRRKVVGEEL